MASSAGNGLAEQARIVGADVGEHAPAWQHDGLTWRHITTGQVIDGLHTRTTSL